MGINNMDFFDQLSDEKRNLSVKHTYKYKYKYTHLYAYTYESVSRETALLNTQQQM